LDGVQVETLRHTASDFRQAIEQARLERAPGALPYFPEGACRMTSRLFAQHLARRPDRASLGHARLVSGVLPGSEPPVRHYWLEVGGAVVDLTADAFGEATVVIGSPTPFHHSLAERLEQDAGEALSSLTEDEASRLARQLAAIEARLPGFVPPAA
jgi:hypothetical protein